MTKNNYKAPRIATPDDKNEATTKNDGLLFKVFGNVFNFTFFRFFCQKNKKTILTYFLYIYLINASKRFTYIVFTIFQKSFFISKIQHITVTETGF